MRDEIGDRLRSPARRVALHEVGELWYRHRVCVLAAQPEGFRRDPGLPGRLRGVIGRRLEASASPDAVAGRPCAWTPACALDPLFVPRRVSRGLEIPKPFVPFVEEEGGILVFGCDIFGFATAWSDAVGEAMVAGLRTGVLDANGKRWPLQPLRRDLTELRGIAPPPANAVGAVLQFVTPLRLRRGAEDMPADAPAAMASLANRISGLARWHDAILDADWAGLAQRWRRLSEDRSGLSRRGWARVSSRQGQRLVPMQGDHGTLLLDGLDAELALLVAIGATTGLGSHTALGLGRYVPAWIVPKNADRAGGLRHGAGNPGRNGADRRTPPRGLDGAVEHRLRWPVRTLTQGVRRSILAGIAAPADGWSLGEPDEIQSASMMVVRLGSSATP